MQPLAGEYQVLQGCGVTDVSFSEKLARKGSEDNQYKNIQKNISFNL